MGGMGSPGGTSADVDWTRTCVCRRDGGGKGGGPRPIVLENEVRGHGTHDCIPTMAVSILLQKIKTPIKGALLASKVND